MRKTAKIGHIGKLRPAGVKGFVASGHHTESIPNGQWRRQRHPEFDCVDTIGQSVGFYGDRAARIGT